LIPGGNVGNISKNAELRSFLTEASANGAVLAGISQAGTLIPQGGAIAGKTLVAKTADDLPQWTRALLVELGSRT
jgi:hypothetical protein